MIDVLTLDHRTTTAISIRIAYGYVLQEGTDPMVTIVEKAIRTIDALATPGLWLVEALPFLRHIPAWFPGAGFQIAAAEMRQQVLAMLNMPYEFAKLQSVTFPLRIHNLISYPILTDPHMCERLEMKAYREAL